MKSRVHLLSSAQERSPRLLGESACSADNASKDLLHFFPPLEKLDEFLEGGKVEVIARCGRFLVQEMRGQRYRRPKDKFMLTRNAADTSVRPIPTPSLAQS